MHKATMQHHLAAVQRVFQWQNSKGTVTCSFSRFEVSCDLDLRCTFKNPVCSDDSRYEGSLKIKSIRKVVSNFTSTIYTCIQQRVCQLWCCLESRRKNISSAFCKNGKQTVNLTAIYRSSTWGNWLTADWMSGDRCAACRRTYLREWRRHEACHNKTWGIS